MKNTTIHVAFQDKECLEDFCRKNSFPMLERNCKTFDVHTFKQTRYNRTEAEDLDKFLEKTSKFIKPAPFDDKKPQSYSEKNFPLWRGQPKICGFHDDGGRQEYDYANIQFLFRDDDPLELAQKIFYFTDFTEKTKCVKMADEKFRYQTGHYMVIDYDNRVRQPRYPIYIVSRGRAWMKNGTSGTLCTLGIKHYIVVEPDEVEEYQRELGNEYATILPFDMSYIDKYDRVEDFGNSDIVGPGPKRNFVWDHSTAAGYKWHWVMDDNAYYMKDRVFNFRYYAKCANFMCACEDYVDMFKNVGQAGLDYCFFYPDYIKDVPYIQNTRIYSFLLNNNEIVGKDGKPYRWRGRYNEDTDLSLRILKDGWCTLDFRTTTFQKAMTQTCKGGNQAEIYSREGTYAKSWMLAHEHPDCAVVVEKYGRIHHYVNYHLFQQKLELKDEWKDKIKDLPLIDDYGTCLIDVGEIDSPQTVTREWIHEHCGDRIRGPQQYILVDAETVTDEDLERALNSVIRTDRSPLIMTDIYKSNSVNNISKICRKRLIPAINYLYGYDPKTLETRVNGNLYELGKVSIITTKDTKLFKQLGTFDVEKSVIF